MVENYEMMDIEKSIDFLSLPESIGTIVLSLYYARKSHFLKNAKKAYTKDEDNYFIEKKSPLERLVIWCCLVPEVIQKYQAEGIAEIIIRDTLYDVTRLAEEYEKQTGKIGLSKSNVIWLRHLYSGNIYQVGSLQFQKFKMIYLDKEGCGEEYMSFTQAQKAKLPPGTPVLNIHVPRKTDFTPKSIEESFVGIRSMLHNDIIDFSPKAFVCYSWLLYSQMQQLLPPNSNITSFAKRFDIISEVSDPYGSDAVKRIYGRRYPNKSSYPKVTSLQRNAIGNFSKLGMACGIIEMS